MTTLAILFIGFVATILTLWFVSIPVGLVAGVFRALRHNRDRQEPIRH